MQTEPDPSPSPPSAESAVGLAFVALVLVSLFVAGTLGVIATRQTAPARATARAPEQTAVASSSTTSPARTRIVTRFRELVLLREIALRERDPGLLASVYVPGAAGLAADRAEIARLRSSGRRLDGLHLPVKVLDATRVSGTRWLVVARIGRSSARLVTGSGRQLRATRASTAVYHCTLVNQHGSWRLLGLVRS
jgi:nucleoid-associated protein YgaU